MPGPHSACRLRSPNLLLSFAWALILINTALWAEEGAVKAPWPPQLDNFDPRLIVTIEQLVRHLSVRGLVAEFERL